MPSEIGPALRAILNPAADALGFEMLEPEMLKPSGGERSRVLQMVSCGAWLLADTRYPDGFPGATRRARRRGAKYVDRNLYSQRATAAAKFLAQAFAVFMEETMLRAGYLDQAEYHRVAAASAQSLLPINIDLQKEIENARSEFRRLDSEEAPAMPANGYHMALLDPERGDPKDPELIEVQTTYANKHFRIEVLKTAIHLTLKEKQFAKVKDDLLESFALDFDGLTWDLANLSAWSDTADKWRDALLL